jgi:hypothetical protein
VVEAFSVESLLDSLSSPPVLTAQPPLSPTGEVGTQEP